MTFRPISKTFRSLININVLSARKSVLVTSARGERGYLGHGGGTKLDNVSILACKNKFFNR